MIFYFIVFALVLSVVALVLLQQRREKKTVINLIANQNFYLGGQLLYGKDFTIVSINDCTPKHKEGIESHYMVHCFDEKHQKPVSVDLELTNGKLKRSKVCQQKHLKLGNMIDRLLLD
ncbi:hypothetical protein [Motilimonas pumila]|uniref:Uncharacterized protein n=1 Tax=Motilimonas pumila TaxID=2303987 RepID=A0A418YA73_9GAMM|nr:hypothetical protein [Motilimonas pumila]RJG39203.1 hypothetical protein D1Z90_18510 [Motilimonas pumila]